MAGTLTHNKFAYDIYSELKDLNLVKDYFIVGNQGHDLLMFMRLWEYPLRRKREKMVDILQEVNITNLVKNLKGKSLETKSFMAGYLAHELLDRKVHPYINKICDNDDDHGLFESIIDYKINDMSHIKRILPVKVALTPTFIQEITDIFNQTFKDDIYSKIILKNINNVAHFIKLYRIDKTGIKSLGYRLIGINYLGYHFSEKELSISIKHFLKLYNEAVKEVTSFLKDVIK